MDLIKSIAVTVSRNQRKPLAAPEPGSLGSFVTVSAGKISPTRLIDIAAARRPTPKHTYRFAVGQEVQMLSGARASDRSSGTCIVVRQLPFEGRELQYRVKSSAETYDRIVAESFLEALAP